MTCHLRTTWLSSALFGLAAGRNRQQPLLAERNASLHARHWRSQCRSPALRDGQTAR